MEQAPTLLTNNLALLINNIKNTQLSLIDWQSEKLNFVPLRGTWFANSEADFDLEDEINKFISPQSNKKVMLLMGDSGAGKSLYTQGLVNKLWQNFSAQSPIPIWISLPSLKYPFHKAIEETLTKYGFNKEQIEELRKTRSFLFILDAYDEIRCEKNLYQTNNLDKWNAKIIITCRREYLYHKDNYKLFFAPFIGDKIQYTQYEEIYIRPFNANQIQTYVLQYIKTQKTNWDNPEKYQKAIEEITGLKELIKTPFMLKLTVEVLPQIVEKYAIANQMERKKVTQAALYDVFVEQWFIRQEQKLKQAKQIKEEENIKPEFWNYAKELATEMHKANVTQVVYNYNEDSDLFSAEIKENQWAKFFTPKNPRIEILRTSCLVRNVGEYHFAFIHSSLLEYFLTRKLFENLTMNLFLDKCELQIKSTNLTLFQQQKPELELIVNVDSKSSSQDYFNQRLIVKESGTLQFLADRVQENETFKKSLLERVYASRNNPENKVSAANAITILNRAKLVFSGMNLTNIQVPDADLSRGIFDHTNFSNANLQNVYFTQAMLRKANFSKALLAGIQFTESPYIDLNFDASHLLYLSGNKRLMVTSGEFSFGKNVINIIDPVTFDISFGIRKTNNIHSVLLNHSESILACGTGDSYHNKEYVVDLIEISSGKSIGLLTGFEDEVSALTFSKDDKYLAIGCGSDSAVVKQNITHDYSVQLWEVNSQKLLQKMVGHDGKVNCLLFHSHHKIIISGSNDKTIRIWDIEKGLELKRLSAHTRPITHLLLPGNGTTIISGGYDGTIRLWDITSGKLQHALEEHTFGISCIQFCCDENILLSGCHQGKLSLWDIRSHQLQYKLSGHTGGISCAALSPDNQLIATGSNDQTIRLWNTTNGELLNTITKLGKIKCITFNHDGKLLFSTSEDRMRCWEVSNLLGSVANQLGDFSCITLNREINILASGDYQGNICLWEPRNGRLINKFFNGDKKITSLEFSFNNNFIIAGDGVTLCVWDILRKNLCFKIQSSFKETRFLVSSKNVVILWSKESKDLQIWNLITGQLIYNLQGHTGLICDVSINPEGNILATGSDDKTIRLWDIGSGKLISLLNDHKDRISSLAFSPNGKDLVSAALYGRDDTIRLWKNIVSGNIPSSILIDQERSGGFFAKIIFSSDSMSLVLVTTTDVVKIYNMQTHKLDYVIKCGAGWGVPRFCPNNKNFMIGTRYSIHIYERTTGKCLYEFDSAFGISDGFFLDDSTLITLNSKDNSIECWSQIGEAWLLSWSTRKNLYIESINIQAAQNLSLQNKQLLEQSGAKGRVTYALQDFPGWHPFHLALINNDIQTVKVFLQDNVKLLQEITSGGDTPLHVAARYSDSDIVQFLLNKGANYAAKNKLNLMPYEIAASCGRKNLLDILPSLTIKEPSWDFLMVACSWYLQKISMVEWLLQQKEYQLWVSQSLNGAHVNTPLHVVSLQNIASLLLRKGGKISLEAINEDGDTPLLCAYKSDKIEIIELLLKEGANLEVKNKDGMTPLLKAVYDGRKEEVELFLNHQANTKACDNENNSSVLHLAAYHLHQESDYYAIASMLLSHGADVHALNKFGSPPLHILAIPSANCIDKQIRILNLFLRCKANPDAINNFGRTVLHIAVREGNSPMVKKLLTCSNSLDLQDREFGNTALHYAAENGNDELVAILLSAKAKIDVVNNVNMTPEQLAHSKDHRKVVNLLKQHRERLLKETQVNSTPHRHVPPAPVYTPSPWKTAAPTIFKPDGIKDSNKTEQKNYKQDEKEKDKREKEEKCMLM